MDRIGRLAAALVAVPLVAAAAVFLLLISPLIALRWALRESRGRWLRRKWERVHGRHGRRVLLVYSDSPNWKAHIESSILPRLEDHAVTLNWSERQRLGRSRPLEWRVFQQWKPEAGYNPLAIVLSSGGPVEVISFWQAFRDQKHGRPRALREAEEHLYGAVRRITGNGG